MKQIILILWATFLLQCSYTMNAQDLRINKIETLPDTTLFSTTLNSTVYFQYNGTTLTVPFKVYFMYSVNGIVQAAPLDSFTYTTTTTTEINMPLRFRTDAPVYRKGDNIVVVWPICNQTTHSMTYYRKSIFVNDSTTHVSIQDPNNMREPIRVWIDNDTRQIVIERSEIQEPVTINLYDVNGAKIYSEECSTTRSKGLQYIASGVYFLEIQNSKLRYQSKVLMY